MNLKCGCKPTVGKKIVAVNKLTTLFAPHVVACYKGQKATIISSDVESNFIVGGPARLYNGIEGHILFDAWSCDCSCEAYHKWMNGEYI